MSRSRSLQLWPRMLCDVADPRLLGWSSMPAHILSGGGRMEHLFVPGRDYEGASQLPHHLKGSLPNASYNTFRRWIARDRRTPALVGAWFRPLCVGGWAESTNADTNVFNLQTPSIFVDLRFPVLRPRLQTMSPGLPMQGVSSSP